MKFFRPLPPAFYATPSERAASEHAASERAYSGRRSRFRRALGRSLALASFVLLSTLPALGFPHVVKPGETLAALAERFYGRIQMERVLSTANSLDRATTSILTPGMILEIPAVTYHKVHEDQTWKSLAKELLGDEKRYILLAQVNDHKPWIEPELGQLIVVPYNLAWIATGEESLPTLAYRFLGSTKHAYQIVQYNDLGDREIERGRVLLLPLSELPLTEEGKAAAELAAHQITEQSHGDLFREQQESKEEARQLGEDIRGGRYVSAVARGSQLLEGGKLTQEGRAQVHRHLLEAYVALDARGLARTACQAWRSLTPQSKLDPLTTSPKILRVCPDEAKVVAPKEDSEKNE
jgi:hypothetical protein